MFTCKEKEPVGQDEKTCSFQSRQKALDSACRYERQTLGIEGVCDTQGDIAAYSSLRVNQ